MRQVTNLAHVYNVLWVTASEIQDHDCDEDDDCDDEVDFGYKKKILFLFGFSQFAAFAVCIRCNTPTKEERMDMQQQQQQLSRIDLLKVGSTKNSCLKLRPLGRKNPTQKIVVGDSEGIVQCFSIKRGAIATVFKTLSYSKPVTNISITPDSKIFVSFGDVVKGFNKKGREFFKLESPMTEEIRHMSVFDPELYIAGEYVLYRLEHSKETGFYMSPGEYTQASYDGKLLLLIHSYRSNQLHDFT